MRRGATRSPFTSVFRRAPDDRAYDPRWTEIYTEKGYMLADPMVFWGFNNDGTIRWSEIDLPDRTASSARPPSSG
ncbi:MAG: autoinducer binding domain-containing protein [Paracoccaceae bacterium]